MSADVNWPDHPDCNILHVMNINKMNIKKWSPLEKFHQVNTVVASEMIILKQISPKLANGTLKKNEIIKTIILYFKKSLTCGLVGFLS